MPSSAIDRASDSQNQAANPGISSWVSANAGSGKTYVLINRVIRFLLAGVPPEKILCLTFTKAAAAEMTNRLFERLSKWAICDQATLIDDVSQVLGHKPALKQQAIARRLFALALETPGGLKIQTIHAFCEALLHRFPVEAGVSAGFDVLDETEQRELLITCRKIVLEKAATGDDPEMAEALRFIIAHVQQDGFDSLITDIVNDRDKLANFISPFDRFPDALAHIAHLLGLEPSDTDAGLWTAIAGDEIFQRNVLEQLVAVLSQSSANDQKLGVRIVACLSADSLETRIEAYRDVFHRADGAPRAKLTTKSVQTSHPELCDFLDDEQARIALLYERLKAFTIWQATSALLKISSDIIGRFAAAKSRRGVLDYDDLIQKTVSLLEVTGASWVLYKLDGGIDHILVDEAQDTSPQQWRVVEYLAAEFFTGQGAHDLQRTIFAVGDEKQSIFSFQGADPAMFDNMRRYFQGKTKDAEHTFKHVPLTVSFRSTQTVLWAVDQVFASDAARAGLSALDHLEAHETSRIGAPGRVEIWPVESPQEIATPDPWDVPLDWQNPDSPRIRLAEKIADTIAGWLAAKTQLPGKARAIKPDDILILVRRRNQFVDGLVRALKKHNVPVAGADRMALDEQIAVMDLVALGQAALLPGDDLTLAVVLKSPLIGMSEDELFSLAYDRTGTLWRNIGARAQNDKQLAAIHDQLRAWFNLAAHTTPFEFFSNVLSAGDGRKKFAGRLGVEVNDPLDEFLNLALRYEQAEPPSLQGFLAWFAKSQTQIKRDLAHGRGEVRIMTVHGAKGLEADIVIMPDTCSKPGGQYDPPVLFIEDDKTTQAHPPAPVWRLNKNFNVPAIATAREAKQAARDEEYHRLLYVAMTRARDWLIICGYETGRRNADGGGVRSTGCWYDLVYQALEPEMQVLKDNSGEISCWYKEDGEDAPQANEDAEDVPQSTTPLPEWIRQKAPPEVAPRPFLSPSSLAELGGDEPEALPVVNPISAANQTQTPASQRGLIIHKLLQHLPSVPSDEREAAAIRYLSRPDLDQSGEQQREILSEVLAVLHHPIYASLFGPESKAEVPILGWVNLPGEPARAHPVRGQIDRLVVLPDEVIILDYKTDQNPPASVEGVRPVYLRQLAAYRAVLEDVYPDKPIKCALLWTSTTTLMEIPHQILAQTLS